MFLALDVHQPGTYGCGGEAAPRFGKPVAYCPLLAVVQQSAGQKKAGHALLCHGIHAARCPPYSFFLKRCQRGIGAQADASRIKLHRASDVDFIQAGSFCQTGQYAISGSKGAAYRIDDDIAGIMILIIICSSCIPGIWKTDLSTTSMIANSKRGRLERELPFSQEPGSLAI